MTTQNEQELEPQEYEDSTNSDCRIQIRGKKTYGICSRLLCCKCFGCCQEEDRSLLTSDDRKDISRRLISQFKSNDPYIADPLQIVIRLYLGEEDDDLYNLLLKARINPNLSVKHVWRDDLEFYIPQICNFLVFHEGLKNNMLKEFLKKVGYINFYFAHSLYFYLLSVTAVVTNNQIQQFPQVREVLDELSDCFTCFYENRCLAAASLSQWLLSPNRYNAVPFTLKPSQNPENTSKEQQKVDQIIAQYGTGIELTEEDKSVRIQPKNIPIKNYSPVITQSKQDVIEHFLPPALTQDNNDEDYEDDKAEENNNNNANSNKAGSKENENIMNNLNKQAGYDAVKQQQDDNLNEKNGFDSTPSFLEDLMSVSDNLGKFDSTEQKLTSLISQLSQMNKHLPAAVYIPFLSNNFRNYVVLNIVAQQSKVFSTKQRTPYYMCLELFRPEEINCSELSPVEDKNKMPLKSLQIAQKATQRSDEIISQPLTVYNQMCQIHSNTNLPQGNQQNNFQVASLNFEPQGQDNKKILNQQKNNSMNVLQSPLMEDQNRNRSSFTRQPSQKPHNRSLDINNNNINNSAYPLHAYSVAEIIIDSVSGISCVYEKGMSVHSHIGNSQKTQFFKESNCGEGGQEEERKLNEAEQNHTGSQLLVNNKSMNSNNNNASNNENSNNKSDISANCRSSKKSENLSQRESQSLELERSIFGEDRSTGEQRIRDNSPFGKLQTWKLLHMIVKTGDNIKQEQFAVQLIQQFEQIFRIEGLSLQLNPYEIVSLGGQCGILQMVDNSITLDGLKKTLKISHPHITNLYSFFQLYYKDNLQKAQLNFAQSLAAYSLVCYFLQIKDRHNGNILLHKQGYIVHIDFGFLLSNAPGKGLAIEEKVPFKLLSEYVEILGGVESELFKTFRRLFFKGFQAARKHQDKILILAKMLYSGHGFTLPCFQKGEQCLKDLEARFDPPDVSNDFSLSIHCNALINQSLDNWRARWYDKWQYFCQGIFY